MRSLTVASVAAFIAGAAAAPRTADVAPGYGYGRPNTYDIPLTWTPLGFTGEIGFGTPAQKLPMFVDWTWISSYLLTSKCLGGSQDTFKCLSKEQKFFKEKASSSFTPIPKRFPSRTWNPNHFFWDKDLTVDYAIENQAVGPVSSKVVIQAADFQFDTTQFAYPFAGVYGLSPVFKGDNASIQSTFYQQWKQGVWKTPYTAFHYCYNGSTSDVSKSTCQGHDGLQTMGTYDPNRIKGRLHWYDVIRFDIVNDVDFIYAPAIVNYWTLKMTGMWIGNEEQKLNTTFEGNAGAVFDHASYGRGAPLSVNGYKRLVAITNAKPITLAQPPNNGENAFFQVDCGRKRSFPTLKYRFGGNNRIWEVTPDHYVEKVSDNTGKPVCVLNIRVLGNGDFIAGNFGETFSKEKYIIFDFEKNRVGISDLKW